MAIKAREKDAKAKAKMASQIPKLTLLATEQVKIPIDEEALQDLKKMLSQD